MSVATKQAAFEFLTRLEKSQWSSAAEIRKLQQQKLANLVAHHKNYSPFYAQYFKDNLPLITRKDIQSAGISFFATKSPQQHHPFYQVQTSGSTGEPLKVFRTAWNSFICSLYTMRDHKWHARDFTGKFSAIRANILHYAETENWGHPVAGLYKTGKGQGIPITFDIAQQLKLLKKFNPEILIIYPNNLKAFLNIWEESRFDLTALRHIKTIGETVSDELRKRTQALTGLKIEDLYSSNELGTIALQCPVSGYYHIMAESMIVEILDHANQPCKIGQIGKLVITDLDNFVSPLIRYEIGDYAETVGPCHCGRGLPVIKKILGRERNLVIKPDGSKHWPLVGFNKFSNVALIRQYQFIQHTRDNLEFRIYADIKLTDMQKDELIKIVQQALDYPFKINIVEFATRLPVAANGKFEEFMSVVYNQNI